MGTSVVVVGVVTGVVTGAAVTGVVTGAVVTGGISVVGVVVVDSIGVAVTTASSQGADCS